MKLLSSATSAAVSVGRRLLAGLVRLLAGGCGLAGERVYLARKLVDLALLLADDPHQFLVALRTDVACRG
jgi:hypothetical protein